MARFAPLLVLTFAAASVVACDMPQARPARMPGTDGCIAVPAEPGDDDDEDEDEDDLDEHAFAADAPCRKPVVYVKMKDWKASPAVLELEEEIRAAALKD
jgi:hypothetical protein